MMTPNPEEQVATPPEAAGKKTRTTRSKAQPAAAKRAKQSAKTKQSAKPKQAAKLVKQAAVARRGSKTAKVLDLLKRPGGASLKELMKTTGWQPHSVRGFLSGTLQKKMGLKLESSRGEGEERAYHLRSK